MDTAWFKIGVLWACVTACETTMFGTVFSPLYPKPYPPGIRKHWYLEVPRGYQIRLTFNHLDIEFSPDCYYDSLTVVYNYKTVLGKFCGQNSTDSSHPGDKPILAPGNNLQLFFRTDESLHELHLGFAAFYQAVDIDECSSFYKKSAIDPPCSQLCHNTLGSYQCDCQHGYKLAPDQHTCILDCRGGMYNESEGRISSPGYPEASPNNLDCFYDISVQPGFTITLNFTENFHIEQIQQSTEDTGCLFHWLQISHGEQSKKICGKLSPDAYQTGSHSVQLEYHTDGYGQSRGWRLHYTTQRVECPHPGTIHNGRVTPTLAQYLYKDYIYVRCDPGYKLMMGKKEIKSFKSVCRSDRKWNVPLPECKIIDCGFPKPLLNGKFTPQNGSNEYKSIVEYSCNEPYYKFNSISKVQHICALDRKWAGENNNDILPPCLPVCGKNTEVVFGGRVFGGKLARLGEIPWQLYTSLGGGASLINDYWAITAAHVVDGHENTTVTFLGGLVDLTKSNSVELKAERIIIHPKYNKVGPGNYQTHFDNDIALIKMSNKVPLSQNLRPVCLPEKSHEPVLENAMGTISGFGGFENGRKSNNLRYGHIQEYSGNCEVQELEVTENMFCAGDDVKRVDSCQGDSGGPLFLPMLGSGSEEQPYEIRGIVSFGRVKCGSNGFYTKVQNYLDWIKKTIANN